MMRHEDIHAHKDLYMNVHSSFATVACGRQLLSGPPDPLADSKGRSIRRWGPPDTPALRISSFEWRLGLLIYQLIYYWLY